MQRGKQYGTLTVGVPGLNLNLLYIAAVVLTSTATLVVRIPGVDGDIGNSSGNNITGSNGSLAPGSVVGNDIGASSSKKEGDGSESHDERSKAFVKDRLAKEGKVVQPNEANEGMRVNEQIRVRSTPTDVA